MLSEEQYPFLQSCAKRIQYLSCVHHPRAELFSDHGLLGCTPCSLVDRYHQYVLIFRLVIASEEADSSEILVSICQATRCHIPEDCSLNIYCRAYVKYHKRIVLLFKTITYTEHAEFYPEPALTTRTMKRLFIPYA
jgi:hypothetical protein